MFFSRRANGASKKGRGPASPAADGHDKTDATLSASDAAERSRRYSIMTVTAACIGGALFFAFTFVVGGSGSRAARNQQLWVAVQMANVEFGCCYGRGSVDTHECAEAFEALDELVARKQEEPTAMQRASFKLARLLGMTDLTTSHGGPDAEAVYAFARRCDRDAPSAD